MSKPSLVVWLTVGEIADALRVSEMTIYRLVHSGELASVQIGATYRIRESSLLDYLNRPKPAKSRKRR